MTNYELAVCPVCRAGEHRVLADRTEIEREVEWLWQFHLRRLKAGAPIHQLFDRAIFSQRPPLQVVACRQCGTVYRNPRERDVQDVYEEEEPSRAALDSLFEQQYSFYVPRVRKLERLIGGRGSAVEVGSYLGAFLKAATDLGWDAIGLDVNARANAFARDRGVTVVETTIDEYLPGRTFDVVALWNCFDQLPDPAAALRAAHRLLSDGGVLAIRVPNGACYARSSARRILAWNNLATFPYRHGFTPDSLTRLLGEAGFDVHEVVLDTLVPISGPWTRRWARWEERLLKSALRAVKSRARAPWFEIYAARTVNTRAGAG